VNAMLAMMASDPAVPEAKEDRMNEHLTLTRRTALITGATSGIGFHTAAALARGDTGSW
jgi:hypothetical protein